MILSKRLFLFCLLLIFSSCARYYGYKFDLLRAKTSISREAFSDSLDFNFGYKLIVIDVEINGKKFPFIFDTGATSSVISSDIAEEFELKKASKVRISDSRGIRQYLDMVIIDSLKISNTFFTEVAATVIKWPENSAVECIASGGIIGNDIIRTCNWRIDYESSKLYFADSDLSLEGMIFIEMKSAQYRPRLDISLDGFALNNVLLDLGSAGGLDLSNYIYKRENWDELNKPQFSKIDGSTQGLFGAKKDSMLLVQFDSLKLGPYALSPIVVDIERKNGSKFGNKILENFDVYLDYTNERLGLSPNGDLSKNINPRTFGVQFTLSKDNELIVASKTLDQSGFTEMLNVGDTVYSLNGRNGESLAPYCNFLEEMILNKLISDSLFIKINQESKEFEIPIMEIWPRK